MNAVRAVHASTRVLLQNGCADAKSGNVQDLCALAGFAATGREDMRI